MTKGKHYAIALIAAVGLAAGKEVINYVHNKYGAGGDSVAAMPFLCSVIGGLVATGLTALIFKFI